MEEENEKITNPQEGTVPPTKCTCCGKTIGLFQPARRTKDGVACMDCTATRIEVLQKNVWAGEAVAKWINRGNVLDEQIKPNGVDLIVDKVLQQRGNVILAKEKKDTRKGVLWDIPIQFNVAGLSNRGGWVLEPGYYTVQWAEYIQIPHNAIGLLSPRSTLLRTCATIYGAIWDRGYHGIGQSGLHVFDYLLLERGTPLAQMCFIGASIGNKTYNGQYQGENVDAPKEKEKETPNQEN